MLNGFEGSVIPFAVAASFALDDECPYANGAYHSK